jgi:hypothetical protein
VAAFAVESPIRVDLAAVVPAGVAAILELPAIVPTVVAAVRVSMPIALASVTPVCIMTMAPSTAMLPGFVAEAVAVPIAMVVPAIPGARSDEDSIHEIARPVVTVGRAGVRVIIVVAVLTNRRARDIRTPNHNAYRSHSNSN